MKKFSQSILAVLFIFGLIALSVPATAQLPPPTDDVKRAFPAQKHYSPYAGRNFPTKVFWGDTHLHTGNSLSEWSATTRKSSGRDSLTCKPVDEVSSSPRAKRCASSGISLAPNAPASIELPVCKCVSPQNTSVGNPRPA